MDNNNYKPLSPKWTGSIFVAFFGFLFLLLTKYMLLSLQQSAVLPFFSSLLIVLMTGAFLGYLFGDSLIKKRRWIYSFLWGMVIALIALVLISIAIFIHAYFFDPVIINRLNHWQDYFIVYGTIFLSLLLIIGLWLMLLMGLAAVYFNKRLWPTLLSIDKLRVQSHNQP